MLLKYAFINIFKNKSTCVFAWILCVKCNLGQWRSSRFQIGGTRARQKIWKNIAVWIGNCDVTSIV